MLKVKYKWNEAGSWQTTPQFWCSAFCTKLQSPGEDMCNVQLCNCVIIYQITQSTIKLRLKLNSDRSSLGRLTSMFENLFFSNIFTKSESVRFGTESSPRPLKYKCRNDDYDVNHVGPKLEQLTWLRCTISHLGLSNGYYTFGLHRLKKSWRRLPKWVFKSKFAKVWAKWEDDEEASHAQVFQVELLIG